MLDNDRIVGVLLAGGEGKRLWPLSTHFHPKQFIKLGNENALLVNSIQRNAPVADRLMVVANIKYRYLIHRDLVHASDKPYTAILESAGRNTAPSIAFAVLGSDPDDILVVTPTDACIKGLDAYYHAVDQAIDYARQGFIATLGITPTSPHTGYGYIHHQGNNILDFTEKPDYKTAQRYVAASDYLWNSGIFIFRARTMREELEHYCPDILKACEHAFKNAERAPSPKGRPADGDDILLRFEDSNLIPSQSIDYAVIEKSSRLKVVPASFEWNDLGSIESMATMFPPDEENNRVSGSNVILSDCRNASVINDGANNLVVANGLDDVVIANTNNVVYISKRGKSQEIKQIVEEKVQQLHTFTEENLWSERPWGYYEVLLNTPHYKVKRLTIEPGMQLSFQEHSHRTEFWVVVVGEGTATIGDEVMTISTPQCVTIPAHTPHRISNTSSDTLRIIEVATGDTILETDIYRICDDFGR